MQRIVDKYALHRTKKFLFPILRTGAKWKILPYKNALVRINRNLKKIGCMAGIYVPLTTYVARHSWANAARDQQIPLQVISEGLGHRDLKTTQIYLASLNRSTIDDANHQIISGL